MIFWRWRRDGTKRLNGMTKVKEGSSGGMRAWRVEPCRGRYVGATAAHGWMHAALLEVSVHHEVGHLAVARAATPVQPHHVEAVVV